MSPWCRRVVALVLLALAGAFAAPGGPAPARAASYTLKELTNGAARVFRGRCVGAEIGTADFAGKPIVATTYVFQVSEYLKGSGPGTLRVRQAGSPRRQGSDLGRIAGLPVYVPGNEYVVFLRPESRAGLTSPSGKGRGVFIVRDERLHAVLQDGVTPASDSEVVPYDALRRAVLQLVGRSAPLKP
jgi:hypothetical protein